MVKLFVFETLLLFCTVSEIYEVPLTWCQASITIEKATEHTSYLGTYNKFQ